MLIGFDEPAPPAAPPSISNQPLFVGFEEEEPAEFASAPLELAARQAAPEPPADREEQRAAAAEATDEAERPAPVRRPSVAGIVGSLAVHLAALLLIVNWNAAPAESPPPIPVQLVIEQPPLPPQLPAPPEAKPPPIPIASENMGGAPPALKPAPPQSTPPPQLAAAFPPAPKPPPKPAKPPPPKSDIIPSAHRVEPMMPSSASKEGLPGPPATRDEYLARLVALTRRHIDLLPMSLIGQRRGETILHLIVLGDGTIARIAVLRGSGYPDIDERIEQMVVAVRRFPPLPQWYQGPSMELNLRLRFPDAVQE